MTEDGREDWPRPGDTVDFADGELVGKIEEVIWARGQAAPLVLVEYWLDGDLRAKRLHAADVTIRRRAGQ